MNQFLNFLKVRLINQLPGINSHLKMAPKVLQRSFRNLEPTINARQSAVLIPLFIKDNDIEIVFTLRSENLKSHKGQISFPGGRLELDEKPEDAALRESYEEIGLNPNSVEIIGKLSNLFVPPSNSLIFPFIGIIKENSEFVLNESEVEECFSVSINHFRNKDIYNIRKVVLEGIEVDMPYWDLGKKNVLWGATSMILKELLDLYEEFESQNLTISEIFNQ